MKYLTALIMIFICMNSFAQENEYSPMIEYYDAGDYRLTISEADSILKNGPDKNAFYYRAVSHYMLKEYEQARNDFEHLADEYDGYLNTFAWLADVYFFQKEYEKSINAAGISIAQEPEYDQNYLLRALSLEKLGRYDEALMDLDNAIKIKSMGYYLRERARINLKAGNFAAFWDDLSQFVNVKALLLPPVMWLAGFLISLIIYLFISGKNIENKQKHQQYTRITGMLYLPAFFLMIYLVSSLKVIAAWADILLMLQVYEQIIMYLAIALLVSFSYYMFVFCFKIIPGYQADRKWRGIDISFGRQFKLSSTFFIYIFMIQIAAFLHSFLIKSFSFEGPLHALISVLSAAVLVLLVMTFYPQVIAAFYGKNKKLSMAVSSEYLEFLKSCGLKTRKINIIKTSDIKMANAWVSGIGFYSIVITDYLLLNFDKEEVKSVLAHEIGHIKRKHLIFNYLFILFWLFSSSLISKYISSGILVYIIYTMFLFLFLIKVISRKFEFQADEYAVSQTGKADVYASMLEKIGKRNLIPFRYRKVEEKMATHPSIEKRIARIRKLYPEQFNGE